VKYKLQMHSDSRPGTAHNLKPSYLGSFTTRFFHRKEYNMSPELLTGLAGLIIVITGGLITAYSFSKK
jgi:hypothetical protein